MLRAKHLGTLSQSARSFFFSGSRCSAADGTNSCTCSDEDTCISRRPLRTTTVPKHIVPPTSLLSKPHPVPVIPLASVVLVKEANAIKPENAPPSQKVVGDVSYPDEPDVKETIVYSSPPIADHFVKAGMAAVGLLSDLVIYRIPMSSGSSMLTTTPNSVVDRTKPVSNVSRSVNTKASKKDRVYVKLCTEQTSGPKVRDNRPNSAKVDKLSGKLVEESRGEPFDKVKLVPQKPRTYSNRFMPSRPRQSEGFKRAMPAARQSFNSNPIVESVYCILHQYKWGPATEEALGRLNCSFDAYQANQVFKQLQDYTVALGFFYWLKRKPGFKHDGHTYTTMVGILGRARQFGAINKLLDQMVIDGCQPNIVTYNRLIHSYGRANYLNEAMGVFNQMHKVGCEPDRVTYCTLIDIHAKSGYLDVPIDLYQRMQEVGLSPDTFTYSVIINCLGKGGHLASAHTLFCEMVDQGCVPNLVTYNIMIALHAKARNYQSSLQLYRDMQKAGFEPDKVTYSIVMEVLGHCGFLDEAKAIFAEMKRKNWVPDEPVYGLLGDMWGKAGNVEKAWGWYKAMLNAGLCPNVPTCNSLLSAFLRVHRLRDAYNLLQSMVGLGLSPSLQTYTLLLSCCTEAQTSFDMGFCCRLMTVTGHPAHTFLLSMPPLGPDGQNVRDHVSRFLEMMHSEDRESKRGLVDAVIDFFHKTGLKEEAGSVWEVAAQKNVYPDAVRQKGSRHWLINLHVMSDGTAVTALSRTLAWFRKEMLVCGICPSRIDIVIGWGRRSRVTGASMVRHAVEELLNMFSFPFFTENGNSGCFVGCGEPLNQWLLESYVERMHLL